MRTPGLAAHWFPLHAGRHDASTAAGLPLARAQAPAAPRKPIHLPRPQRQHALTVGELDGVSSSLAALGVTAPQEVRDATGHEQPQAERDLVVEHLLASITQYLYICEELVIDT